MVAYVSEDKIAMLNLFSRPLLVFILLMREGNYALELMNTNPALVYLLKGTRCLSSPWKSKNILAIGNKLMKMKRKNILGYFGFPACETMVKIFVKIKPEHCSVDLFFLLRTTLQKFSFHSMSFPLFILP